MKKKIITICVIVVLVLIPVALILWYNLFSGNIRNGKFYVTNCEEYPDAYIEVKDEKIFIYNMDLNALYQEKQIENLRSFNKIYELNFTEEEIMELTDLNYFFSVEGYDASEINPIKLGTFEYWYGCLVQDTTTGLHIKYNSWKNTMVICNQGYNFTFK